MNSAQKFLERVSTPQDIDGDTVENVSISDALHATQIAVLEFAKYLHELEPNLMRATVDDKIRQLQREHIKIEA